MVWFGLGIELIGQLNCQVYRGGGKHFAQDNFWWTFFSPFRTVLRKLTKFVRRKICPAKNLRRLWRRFPPYVFPYGPRKKPPNFSGRF